MALPHGGSVLAALFVLVSACGGTVAVEPPDAVTPEAADACTDLVQQLPDTVLGEESRPTDPDSASTAAWGNPAIALRCGVARPAALKRSSQLINVDGVDWFAEELTAGYVFTATGRSAFVEVTVPDDYTPEIGPVTELSPLVDAVVAPLSN